MPDDVQLPEEASRELEGRRRDLEREFDGKLRDLKAQHRRQMDHLERDRAEWEEHRKRQLKDLADREERLRRHDDNARQAVHRSDASQRELDELRKRVQELEEEKLKAKVAHERLAERVAVSEGGARSAKATLTFVAFLLALATAGWLVVALQSGGNVLLAAGAFVLSLVLAWWSTRLRVR